MTISKSICKTAQFSDSVFYTTVCECKDPEHNQYLVLEYDEEFNSISLCIYSNIHTNWYINNERSWWYKIKKYLQFQKYKAKIIIQLLFNGYIAAENEFIFSDEQAIVCYIQALEEGIAYIKNNQN